MILESLRKEIEKRVSEKRFSHILGVEKCAYRIALKLLPEKTDAIRAAALLHDVTKEMTVDEHMRLLKTEDFPITDEDRSTPGVLHSFTAPIVIKRDFSSFADSDILSATLKHTVGDENMTVFDKIIFVSDYAEDTRKYKSCIKVREALFDNFDALSYEDALIRLDEACLASINGAEDALLSEGQLVNSRMNRTKLSLIKHKL